MTDPWYRWPKGLREAIFKRDDYHCRIRIPTRINSKGRTVPVCKHTEGCYRCATVVDHIIPALSGGAWFEPSNLRAACQPCNNERRQRSGPRPSNPTRVHPEHW